MPVRIMGQENSKEAITVALLQAIDISQIQYQQ
jgi:hypothetical protein